MQTAATILQSTFGYQAFRDQQAVIIQTVVDGHDSLVVMPTGGGKSLCYQIPALLREGCGIVISPLIALMQDQVSALNEMGVRVAFLNSTQSQAESETVINDVLSGQLDLLYIAPERINQRTTINWLQRCQIALIAIDEAHCVSQWGHDFRQDYLSLNQLKNDFPSVPRIALTATATRTSQAEIIKNLDLSNPKQFVSSFDRPNIHYTVVPKTDAKKQLLQFLTGHRDEAGIIYCLSRKKVESTAAWLNTRGLTALPYHAGLDAQTRAENQARFLREDAIVMVATIAFGMGIDKPDVRFVAHMNLPKSIEAYYQETGRAGRDGKPAEAFMTYGLDDVVQLAQFIDNSPANDSFKRHEKIKLDALLGWCEITSCRRTPLLNYFGEQKLDQPENKQQLSKCLYCDNCDNPPNTWDATEAAQKLLSCVYRLNQRFGLAHTIDVLRAKQTEKVSQFNHQQLSTYGIGVELSQNQWRSVARQLIVKGLLTVNSQQFNALTLTTQSRQLLQGKIALNLRQELKQAPQKKNKSEFKNGVSKQDAELWHALRDCRKALADEYGIPSYRIFHDATLMEMMETKPQNMMQLLRINGVGEAKLKNYGQAFLEVINSID